jgi:glycosyltransferase involved in cell wall biosynthesis
VNRQLLASADVIDVTMIAKDAADAVEIGDPLALAPRPIVSVLMFTYNHRSYIAQAIDGVVAQVTRFPMELLIGEDFSGDGTREVVEDYQRRYPHSIRVISGSKNVGAQRNFQRALARARGVYIAFCDGDDWWIDRNKLQKQYELI